MLVRYTYNVPAAELSGVRTEVAMFADNLAVADDDAPRSRREARAGTR